ncbi:MAG: methylenetetrahydrofolate reductase [NAD(P)H] [Rhizobiaceae bacterium]|nr:methylenetetrahydrofolate reductase [NAD(P)H] [Rhizobiaceae bacterium]
MTHSRTLKSSISRRSLKNADFNVSFEFFPTSSDSAEASLWKSVRRLESLSPSFVSITYGAGGSTRERTHKTILKIIKETDLKVAAHLTCVDASKEEVDSVVRDYWRAGVRHFVALRGDSQQDTPKGTQKGFQANPDGYQNGAELVAGLKAFGDFDITVSAYPEKHPMSPDFAVDIEMLKRKVDNGATRAITQFFFDNDVYEAYVERVRSAGIFIPIIPGILPFHNFSKLENIARRCGASVPDWLAERFEGLENDATTSNLVGCAVASEQVMDLVNRGVSDFHFYTMNQADLVYAICRQLGMRAVNERAAKAA